MLRRGFAINHKFSRREYLFPSRCAVRLYADIPLVVCLIDSALSFACGVFAFKCSLDNIFIALFQNDSFDIVNIGASVMVVIVRRHAGGEVYRDFVLFDISLVFQFI